jgi:peptide-methionine (S)-S-oxide reductase
MNEHDPAGAQTETATLGGGCFWCLEAVYDDLQGVLDVVSGYSGGSVPEPSYQLVCTGSTGHAEVVRVVFDPQVISYLEILKIFFSIHDPTTLNRQGADVGTQYRSVIFIHSPEQERTARDLIRELEEQRIWDKPIVTQVLPAEPFYEAEAYHQEYFARNPGTGYCIAVVAPKVAKFRKANFDRLKR